MVDLYADMFDLAPVSLWLEDFSQLKALFGQWRAQGITDLRRHLREQPECISQCSQRIQVLRVNQRTLAVHGARDQKELTDNLHRLFRDDMLGTYVEELVQLWEGQLNVTSQTVNYTLSGERRVFLLKASVLPGHEAHWDRVLVAMEDVTERERSERYARSLFEHSPASLMVADVSGVRELLDARGAARGAEPVAEHAAEQAADALINDPVFAERCLKSCRLVDANWRTLAMFGATHRQELAAQLHRVFREEMRASLVAMLASLARGQCFQQHEALAYSLDGRGVHVVLQVSVLPGHETHWDQLLLSMTDITARKEAEAEVAYLSTHDALTGLHNRVFFRKELTRLNAHHTQPVTLLAIDVNGLKNINDTQGHHAGDDLLVQAGRLLEQAITAPMTVSRIGGDEFAVLMPGLDQAAGERVIAHVLAALDAVGNLPRGLSLSIGAATRQPGESMESVLHRADLRMYEAKRQFYEERGWDRRTR